MQCLIHTLLSSLSLLAILALSSCSSVPHYQTSSVATKRSGPPSEASYRPGLATTAGWEMQDRARRTEFYRLSSSPSAVGSIYYNDERGAKAMAELAGGSKSSSNGAVELGSGQLRVSLQTYGDILPHYTAGTRHIFAGEAGSRYSVQVENRTKQRVEVVVSVDGLDVLTGAAAGFLKRGHVIEPRGSIGIDGFRSSATTVKTFEFGGVAESKAAKSGGERNVGIIGFALFLEDEAKAKLKLATEQMVRDDAAAFPVH
jgi:hypothetical protein